MREEQSSCCFGTARAAPQEGTRIAWPPETSQLLANELAQLLVMMTGTSKVGTVCQRD